MPTTVTLERIEAHLPERAVTISDLSERLGLRRNEAGVFRRIHGLDQLRYDPDLNLFDLLLPAARRALAAAPDPDQIAYVMYAHTMLTLAPPDLDVAQVLKDRLGLAHADAFALNQQACVSTLGAIDVAGELLRADGQPADGNGSRPCGYALVVTGEQAYSPRVQLIPHSAVMAEAAGACLVTLDGAGDEVRSCVINTLGEYAAGLLMSDAEFSEFGTAYPGVLAGVINSAAREAGLDLFDIDLIIPHNVNMISWRQVIKELGIDSSTVFLENIPRFSHCYSADAFVNYDSLRAQGRLVPGRHYLLASVGLGATFGAMVITHKEP